MTLTDLSLTNFRNHRRLELRFKTGVTGIVGRTGAGKSSIIEGILFGLTGLLFTGDKHEAITLGEDVGKVVIGFTLNNKKGTLTRHLDVSKVVLTYDGVTYKKATEVKELWDKFLQVSSEIVARVLIAQQGQIPLLFCGDPSVREKIFQKIFMVPNTEKLRSLIHKNYIKQCPPVIHTENMADLEDKKRILNDLIVDISGEIKAIDLLKDSEVRYINNRLQFIQKCVDDVSKIAATKELVEAKEHEFAELSEICAHNGHRSVTYNLPEKRKQLARIHKSAALMSQKQKIQDQLDNITFNLTEEEYLELEKTITERESKVSALNNKLSEFRVKRNNIKADIDKFSEVTECPTCHQNVGDIHDLVHNYEEDLVTLDIDAKEVQEEHKVAIKQLEAAYTTKKTYEDILNKKQNLTDMLLSFGDESYSEVELKQLEKEIPEYEELDRELAEARLEAKGVKTDIELLKQQLEHFSEYDSDGDINEEKNLLLEALSNNQENNRIVQQKKITMAVKEAELTQLLNTIKETKKNMEANEKRNRYVKTLNLIYDLFHSSNFPRKLILDYADIVTDHLQEHLQKFSIPYSAKVADSFKIEVLDDEGRALPTVSGGQQVQVGLSLHLALHDLFGQSFPLMIIDEGTTHQDTANQKAYFDILKQLKEKSKFRQIIIIDHHPDLAEVVDQTIELK
jgi:exonuclease SbcC